MKTIFLLPFMLFGFASAVMARADADFATQVLPVFEKSCIGCHGEHLSGGHIPGAPPSIPVPLNLTPDATGMSDWTFDDFDRLMRQAIRKDGKPLDAFMPVEAWRNLDAIEMHAIWAYLRALPPTPFGSR